MSDEKQFPKIAVGVLVYNDNNKIFLARSPKWNNLWCVPGGHLDWGETLADACIREVKEETNLDVEEPEFLEIQEAIFPKEFHKKKHMLFPDYCAKIKNPNQEVILNPEFDRFDWFTYEDTKELEVNPFTRKLIETFKEKKLQ